jgi:hypothetical protein
MESANKVISLRYSKGAGFQFSLSSNFVRTLVFVVLTVSGVLPNSEDWWVRLLEHRNSHHAPAPHSKKTTRKA